MIKRVTWFVAGAATGAAGAVAATRKVRRAAQRLAPANVARGAVEGAKQRARHVVEAMRDGRVAMVAKEQELRARRDGHPVAHRVVGGHVIEADVVGATGAGAGAAAEPGGHGAHGVHDLAAWRQRSRRRARGG